MSKKITRTNYKDVYGYCPTNNYKYYKIGAILIGLILIGLGCIGYVNALPITIQEETSYNYIIWNWSSYEENTDVYIDGVLTLENTTIKHYVLSDIGMDEKHIIDVYGNNTDYGGLTSQTEPPFFNTIEWIYIVMWLVLILLGFYTKGWFYPLISWIPALLLILSTSLTGYAWSMILAWFLFIGSIFSSVVVNKYG